MERLVEWNCKEKNSALPKCINEWGDVVDLETICAQLATIYDILGDIGIDRLRELVKAEMDGRCVVIPCEAGDKVWFKDIDGRIVEEAIFKIGCWGETWSMNFGIEDIGKTVFLTREAAENALRGGD